MLLDRGIKKTCIKSEMKSNQFTNFEDYSLAVVFSVVLPVL